MGKFGCRLYCWGCGGCCIITGVIVGILAALIPSGMMMSIQESAFDMAYIDDTSQTEAEGLFADAGAPIAESDAFKAWGKKISDGFNDCMKADFAFDWAKSPQDCVDGLHPTFSMYNITNTDTWGSGNLLELQEVGMLAVLRDTHKIEADTAYWDETGKARFREHNIYSNDHKCDEVCEDFAISNSIVTTNIWYGVFTMVGLADGWTVAHAVTKAAEGSTLDAYLKSTEALPMDPHSALPVTIKTIARTVDFVTFLYTPNAPKLGTIDLKNLEYTTLRKSLWDQGKAFLESMAPKYGVSKKVVPVLITVTANGVLGWGAVPVWVDVISSAPFTFNFVAGASARESTNGGAGPSAFMEEKMSSVYYHEGLGYVTQHYEANSAATSYNHSCAWDPDCAAPCFPTDTCAPLASSGFDGGKIPGTYFGSPKGQPGLPEFRNFILTYYLVLTLKSAGRVVIPAKYKGPNAAEHTWDFEGYFVHSTFKSASWNRRIENCNYPDGRLTESGEKDSPGIDCNSVKDTSPLQPYFGLPLYWHPMIRDSIPGWDSALTNSEDGAKSITMQTQIRMTSCRGNKFCTDDFISQKGGAFTGVLHYAYEPNLGALVDVSFVGALGWKLSVTPMHQHLMDDPYKFMPLFWFWNYLHLPGAINMDLAKLQVIPAALNGFYIFLLGQCMVSLVGGVACCFCGA